MASFANMDVRKAISESGLYAYQVAERLGMAETSFSRLMRKELSDERKAKIFDVLGGEKHAKTAATK